MINKNNQNIISVNKGLVGMKKIYTGINLVWGKIKGLPHEYQEVVYLESTGTQRINTNIPTSKLITAYIDTEFTEGSETVQMIFWGAPTVGNWVGQVNYKYALTSTSKTDIDCTLRKILKTTFEEDKNILTVDNTTISRTGTHNNGNYYTIFKNSSYAAKAKVYNVAIFENNIKIAEYIPCYRKIDKKPGMYDIVNNLFYTNAGTGEFIIGEEIINLPVEYQRVEYIETTGTQYINTNFIPNNNTKIEVEYMITAIRTQIVFGSRTEADSSRAYNGVFITHRSTTAKVAWSKGANSNIEIQGYNDINTQYTAFFNKNKVYINDNLVHNFNEIIWEGNYPIFVGCVDTKGSPEFYAKCKYYGFKIWNENVLERDLVPCYRKSDNEAGMYDLVNNVFYTNAGTGTLIVGSDV